MIDIHSHILPGLDDGPATLEECVAMVRLAAASGTTDIVASPHANLDFQFNSALVDEKIAELEAACGPAPRIHRGCDFHLTYDNIQDALAHPGTYAINRRNYLLVEFSDLLISRSAGEIFTRMREAGIIPVITHPERNWLLQQRLSLLENWVADGCCLQVTAQSLLGRFGREARNFGWNLIRRNLAQFVASDAHDPEDRTPRLDLAYREIARKLGAARAERLLVDNPRAALEGRVLEWEPEPEPPPPRKWFQFWS